MRILGPRLTLGLRAAATPGRGLWGRGLWSWGLCALLAVGVAGCKGDPREAPLDRLILPTGLALSPEGETLFVTNGNWDRRYANSGLIALELEPIEAGIAAPLAEGSELEPERPCRLVSEGQGRIECDPSLVIDPDLGVRLPSGAGNIAIDRPEGELGPLRLLIPTRIDAGLVWVDALGPSFGGEQSLRLDCNQAEDRRCDSLHLVAGLGPDPSRVTVDRQGFRYAYLPHLLGRRLTLVALDGERGPEVVDVETEFFHLDPLFDSDLGGGFEVVQRACDVESDNAPALSLECARPFLLASERFWWGLRAFRVAPGLDVVLAGGGVTILGPNLDSADPKPLMGGMAFEDPEQGDSLLVVHTTPPALTRVDMSLNQNDNPRSEVVATTSLCTNPNLVVVHRPSQSGAAGPDLAFVSCYGADEIGVVDLGIFKLVQTIAVGDGPNEMVLDESRGWLLVANTAESTISVIGLDAGAPTYLRELATLGLDAARSQAAPQ